MPANKKPYLNFALLMLSVLLLFACGDNPNPTGVTSSTIANSTINIPIPSLVPTTIIPVTTLTTSAAPATTMVTSTAGGYPGKLVYESGGEEIYLIMPDGTKPQKIVSGTSPLFSPDGTRIAFIQRIPTPTNPFLVTISSVNLAGQDKQDHCTASNPTTDYSLVRWHPNNGNIAVNLYYNSPGKIHLCNTSDKKLKDMVEVKPQQGIPARVYDWTTDGKFVLWQGGPAFDQQELYYGEVGKGGVAAQTLSRGQNRRDEVGFKYYAAARFSPDNKTIAVSGSKLFFISTPGQKSQFEGRAIAGLNKPGCLAWSPDGRAIALIDFVGDGGILKLVDLNNNRIKLLAENATSEFDWSRS